MKTRDSADPPPECLYGRIKVVRPTTEGGHYQFMFIPEPDQDFDIDLWAAMLDEEGEGWEGVFLERDNVFNTGQVGPVERWMFEWLIGLPTYFPEWLSHVPDGKRELAANDTCAAVFAHILQSEEDRKELRLDSIQHEADKEAGKHD